MTTLASGGTRFRDSGDVASQRARPDWLRAGFAIAVAAWLFGYSRSESRWTLLDDVDLAIHEAGHVVFGPFGEFAGVAGGSVVQVLVPLAFVAYFAWRREAYAAFVVLFWVSQSLFNVATYIADARAQSLPLVGGEYVIHDWSWMLSRLRLLRSDEAIAGAVRAGATLLWAAAGLGALASARKTVGAEPAPN
jgi:hypothetical protein